ncbi:hypothetical protein B0H13DRAFT_1967484 [Mycena leptocephala]|nr:hypothetical protein B0H13DRAFT_1967484 [Mycena leptocephala]
MLLHLHLGLALLAALVLASIDASYTYVLTSDTHTHISTVLPRVRQRLVAQSWQRKRVLGVRPASYTDIITLASP